jgi:hypothetical protein
MEADVVKASNFRADPYGWATNQIGHAFLVGAVLLTYLPVLACWYGLGEFPPKWAIVVGAGIAYAAYEAIDQGWNGADTVEDWWFVIVYGAAGSTYSFTEISPGDAKAALDLMAALPFLLLLSVHLCFGAWLRWRQ